MHRLLLTLSLASLLPAAPLAGQSADTTTVEPMPPYGSKEVDTNHIEIPGYSGPENERALIVMGCQNAVRSRLRAPASAKFALAPAVLTTDTTVTVVGRVEGMNFAGGYRIMRYECVGTKAKDSWVLLPAVTLHEMAQ